MLLALTLVVPICLVPVTGGSLGHFGRIHLRWMPLLFGALAVAVAVTTAFPRGAPGLHATLNFVTYAAALAVLWANRQIRGIWIALFGTVLNVVAMAANHGVMPASPQALRTAGLAASSHEFVSSTASAHARLHLLGDIFAVPAWFPFSNVFSLGDISILAGAAVAILTIGESKMVTRRLARAAS